MTEQEIAELQSMVKDFQELLKSDKADYYVSCCSCGCGSSLNDEFNDKRKALLTRAETYFAHEEDQWMYEEE
jgi:hypothetical protein